MELVFQEKQLDYLGRVLDQTVTQELTAEVIVPDSCADADRVVDAFGTLLVRAEECTAGSASVSGEVQAGILFVTEDGRLERLETVIPFSARRGWEGEQSDCRLQCVCRLCSVDARLVHSRKLLVRVGVSCTLTVYAAFARTLHDFPEPAPTLQLRRKRLPLRLPRGLGEKSFSLNEEIEIPASKPPVERLLKCVYALDTAERKTIGNKAVFKGRLTVHILYEAPDGSLQRQETELPFSQFAELEQDLDEGDLTVFLALTSAETEPDGQLDCRRLLLSAGILAQCTVCGEQPVELIEDAYCLDDERRGVRRNDLPQHRRGHPLRAVRCGPCRRSGLSRRSAKRRRRPGGSLPPPSRTAGYWQGSRCGGRRTAWQESNCRLLRTSFSPTRQGNCRARRCGRTCCWKRRLRRRRIAASRRSRRASCSVRQGRTA